jgi:hypothetical protein
MRPMSRKDLIALTLLFAFMAALVILDARL